MLASLLTRLKSTRTCLCSVKKYCSSNKPQKNKDQIQGKKSEPLGDIGSKYKQFREEDSEIIFDLYEERLKYSALLEEEETEEDRYEGINLERGITGVFEVEDLVEVLKRENGEDIFVASVPKDIKYVDYMCIVSGRSKRHMDAIAQFVRRVYKKKRVKGDIVPKLEGANSNDWMALDLGNIALHIFSKEARKIYDLDLLWAVGSKFDDECNKKDPVAEMLEQHTQYLAGLEPAS